MHLIFDLDGTLIDSRPGIHASLKQTIQQTFPHINVDSLVFQIGPQIRDIMRTVLGQLTELQLDSLETRFRSLYDNFGWKEYSVYTGVIETLKTLTSRAKQLYIVTNKPQLPTRQILTEASLHTFFCEVITPDTHQPKFRNKASMLYFLLDKHKMSLNQTIYVGDSEEDAISAQICGVDFIGVEYGYGKFTTRSLKKINSFPELLSVI